MVDNLLLGVSVAFSPDNLLFCFIGALLGTLIGVLPGLGPLTTVAVLLPLTFSLEPVGALIMLAGIYYGAQYGGSTTAILVNMPGENSSVVTALDGYKMALQGRAGVALATAALASFLAGTIATVVIAVAGPFLSGLGLQFRSPEYFSLMVLGLILSVALAQGSILRGVLMILAGLFFGLIGSDVETGVSRFTFGIPQLRDGIDFVPMAMGVFGIATILKNLEDTDDRTLTAKAINRLMPTLAELKTAAPAALRGTFIGSVLGLLPGGGATLSSFAAYTFEKRIARDPSRFGNGAIEGVAAAEAANNAGAQTTFIPMLTLGIPPQPVLALMMGAMMIHGIQPGPEIMTKQPELFWGLIVSMWIGNAMLLVINLPLIGIWVRLLQVQYRMLFPAIILFCCVAVYSVSNSMFDLVMVGFFGALGYCLLKLRCEPAPLALGFILGPMLEENLRRSLVISRGDALVFMERPISAGLLIVAVLFLVAAMLPALRKKRENLAQ